MADDLITDGNGNYQMLAGDGTYKPVPVISNDAGDLQYHNGTDWVPIPLAKAAQVSDSGTVNDALIKTSTPIYRGIASVLGMPGELANLGAAGVNLGGKILGYSPDLPTNYFAGSDTFNTGFNSAGISYRDAESRLGKLAQATAQGGTEAAFTAPLALLKGASVAAKARSVAPLVQPAADVSTSILPSMAVGAGSGLGSEAAGQISNDNPAWRLVGGLAGGLLGSLKPATLAGRVNQTLGISSAPTAESVLSSMGIDNASDEVKAGVQALLDKNIQPTPAAIQGIASSLPSPVQLSRGQATGFDPTLRFELNAQQGSLGTGAAYKMRGFKDAQQQALQENVPLIQDSLGPGASSVTSLNDGGRQAQQALLAQYTKGQAQVRQAYGAARDAGVTIDPSVSGDLASSMTQGLADFHPSSAPKTYAILNDLGGDIATAAQNGQGVPLNAWESRRRQLSSLTRGSDPTEAAAANQALRVYDEGMGNLSDNAIYGDNSDAIDAWKNARDTYKNFAGKFYGNNLVQDLTNQKWIGGTLQPSIEPDKAGNAIFGQNGINGSTSPRDLATLKSQLGEDSPEWNAVRGEAWQRIANQAGSMLYGDKAISGAKGATAFNKILTNNGPVMDQLFSPDEQQQMKNYFTIAAKATSSPQYSTAAQASGLLQNLWNAGLSSPVKALAEHAPFVGDIGKAWYGGARTNMSVNGLLPTRAPMPPFNRNIAIAGPTLLDLIGQSQSQGRN